MRLCEYIDSIKTKKVAVIGIGVSNTPLIKKLAENGVYVTARDKADRERIGAVADELEKLGAKLILGDGYLDDLNEDIIFRTPGMRPDGPELSKAIDAGAELTSEMELFFKVCPCRMIAVTGSDGKTTTTTIISKLLEASGKTVHVGGNIGRPLLCDADEMSEDDVCVLELSSFQLMTMKDSPEIAVVTNLAPNHLDIHKNMAEYVDAKKNIFLHQNENSLLVLNADNDITASFVPLARGKVSVFSMKEKTNGVYLDGDVIRSKDGDIMNASEIFLPGRHNIENYMAAFAAVEGLVSKDVMREVAKTFTGVEHRIEYVRTLDGVKYYNDSIASSPSRTTAGLRSFTQKVILIAGGKDKGVPFDSLGVEICEHVKKIVLTGFTAEKLREAVLNAENYSGEPEIFMEPDFKKAVLKAREIAGAGDVVILSPACTSFDHFRNFMERGLYFKEIVNGME